MKNLFHDFGIFSEKFWRAPELLVNRELPCTKESDIYSYGIILSEICTRDDPYRAEMDKFEYEPSGKYIYFLN